MRCDPAHSIIETFGGISAVAKIAGVTPHSVMRWRTPREKGGTGGFIPHWHVQRLLKAASDRGLPLQPVDFMPASPGSAAPPAPTMEAAQ